MDQVNNPDAQQQPITEKPDHEEQDDNVSPKLPENEADEGE